MSAQLDYSSVEEVWLYSYKDDDALPHTTRRRLSTIDVYFYSSITDTSVFNLPSPYCSYNTLPTPYWKRRNDFPYSFPIASAYWQCQFHTSVFIVWLDEILDSLVIWNQQRFWPAPQIVTSFIGSETYLFLPTWSSTVINVPRRRSFASYETPSIAHHHIIRAMHL